MPNQQISQLQINGTTYDIADATARDSISQLGQCYKYVYPGVKSCPNNNWVELTPGGISLSDGHYLFVIYCYSAGNATGHRHWKLDTSLPTGNQPTMGLSNDISAGSTNAIYTTYACVLHITEGTTWSLYGFQNSGGALNMGGEFIAIKLNGLINV